MATRRSQDGKEQAIGNSIDKTGFPMVKQTIFNGKKICAKWMDLNYTEAEPY